MATLLIPPARGSRWESVHVDDKPHRRHVLYDETLDLERPIYRYMPAAYLLEFLRTGQFHFSSVASWPDPFEQWWHTILFAEGSPLHDARAFASCWTWRSRDERFWRLYENRCDHRDSEGMPLGRGPPPVRIQTTLKKLIDAVCQSLPAFDAKVFFAPVGYAMTEELLRYRNSLTSDPAEIAREAAHALTFKRLAFKFEKEVRVIWIDRSLEGTFRRMPLDPNAFIERVMIGPVLENEVARAEAVRQELGKAGFQGVVQRSLIYRAPPP
ncbi:hypothetical protein [Tahibacter sp.]|uniref:hypothetical protein n=1 Tax=Tahibacter sp. TaxID=2056211 RepID=UPI0028C3C882|nr:hypothetical protein [Tahibacter sp.]